MGKFIDETGNRYGRLVVLERVKSDRSRQATWRCKCDCENEVIIAGHSLRSGNTRSCGCFKREHTGEAHTINMVGRKYGRLTVVERHGSSERGHARWLCRCDCGNEVVVDGSALRSGHTKSCGCFQRERVKELHSLLEGIAAFNALVSNMQHSAKMRALEWQLTDEQVAHLTKQVCHYCGAAPSQVKTAPTYNGVYIYNGLDRLDNGEGYIISNVVPCCKVCNYAKRVMTPDEFESWIVRAYIHLMEQSRIGEAT